MIKRHAAVAAPVAGVLLGVLDFVWIKYVPFPFGDLGNSMAVWAVAAFLLTYRARWGWAQSLAAAAVLLVVAVPSYYLAATLIQNDNFANMYAPYALIWMALGVVGGLVFGAAGVVAHAPGPGRPLALGLPGGVLLAEALSLTRRIGDPSYGDTTGEIVLRLILAVLLTLLVAPSWRLRTAALLCAVPVGLVGFGLFAALGFG